MFRAVLKKTSVTISACGWHHRLETESTSGSKHVSGAQQHSTSSSAGTNSHYINGGCCGYSAQNYTIKCGTERRHRRLSPCNCSSRPCGSLLGTSAMKLTFLAWKTEIQPMVPQTCADISNTVLPQICLCTDYTPVFLWVCSV